MKGYRALKAQLRGIQGGKPKTIAAIIGCVGVVIVGIVLIWSALVWLGASSLIWVGSQVGLNLSFGQAALLWITSIAIWIVVTLCLGAVNGLLSSPKKSEGQALLEEIAEQSRRSRR